MSNLAVLPPRSPYVIKQTDAKDDLAFLGVWLHGRPKTTQRIYRSIAKDFLAYVGKPLKQLMLEDIQSWCTYLGTAQFRGRSYSPNTIKNKTNCVKSLFSFAKKVGYLAIDKGAVIKAPKPTATISSRIVSESDISKLIAAAPKKRDRIIIKSLYLLGLRISELMGLNWKNIRLRCDGSGIVTVLGKGGKLRDLFVPSDLMNDWQGIRTDKPQLFSNHRGKPLSVRAVNFAIKDAANRAGVNPKISAHWIRHCHASHSLKNGCDLDLLRDSLGHSSLAITSIYIHSDPDRGSSQFLNI